MADESLKRVSVQNELHYLERIARDQKTLVDLVGKVIKYIVDAESEIPERMRRFIMYMHDVHDVMWMYHENGQEPPEYIKHEARRCDDRYRQILAEMHSDTGAFEKVRREMATDPLNRYDHTRLLLKQTHKGERDETR